MDEKTPDYTGITVLTIALLIGFGYAMANLNIYDIQKNWEDRRCEPPIIMSGWLYKPENYDGDNGAFALDNFNFCISKFAQYALTFAITPVLGIMGKTDQASQVVQQGINMIREIITNIQRQFLRQMSSMFGRFTHLTHMISMVLTRLKFGFSRFNAVLLSIVYAGLSGIQTLRNSINFVIMVCIIILTILVVIFILLFFVLFPFAPLILTTIGVITAAGLGSAVSGMSDTFCVPEGTMVRVKGGWKRVEEIVPGEALDDKTTVEGVIQATGRGSEFVSIRGSIIGQGHLVYDDSSKKWVSSEEHSEAKPMTFTCDTVYCLNTTNGSWTIASDPANHSTYLLLRDWEELPRTAEAAAEWESRISKALECSEAAAEYAVRPMLGKESSIVTNRGHIPISQVRVGDMVADWSYGFIVETRVLAVVHDTSVEVPLSGPNHGCWSMKERTGNWGHPLESKAVAKGKEGYHLITESGTFLAGEFYLRDFSDVGLAALDTYRPWILSLLNRFSECSGRSE
jgi:hypothetical protein